ncbi:AraC family transcriptional regulator ligand-binding domain-containing protein [Aquirhabdus sp.]|uniref:AraC family transcriptional regulator n=1 Tax=Aquirhabdus sp. TaxID=2824160 RepID=UPI00396C307D
MDVIAQFKHQGTHFSASNVSYMLRFAEQRGATAEQLLANTGLLVTDLYTKNAHIQVWQHLVFLDNLFKAIHDPSLAIEIGLASNLTKIGLYGLGLMSSTTLWEAVEFGRRYMKTQYPFFESTFEIQDDTVVITLHEIFPLERFRAFIVENFLIDVAEIYRSLMLGEYRPTKYQHFELYFDCPEPEYFAAYKERLPELHFNRPANQFRFPAKILHQPIHTANPAMVHFATGHGELELARLGLFTNWIDHVRALLISHEGAYPSIQSLADQLCMSPRTLTRKLTEVGLSFSELLEEVRLRDAQNFLKHTKFRMDDIAVKLGYQNSANFIRAFQRWTGITPSEYRKSLEQSKHAFDAK